MAADFVVVPTATCRLLFVLVIIAHARTHLALGKDVPISRPVTLPSAGRIVATPQVGGLHHRYNRTAA